MPCLLVGEYLNNAKSERLPVSGLATTYRITPFPVL